ncbi:hypothetical protein B296_00056478 [Ensete ventricosum]|uniref:Uncharacterized protein n=1 Tax=Ensete ventricosum TaxID=4639 RepID=A0A426XF53_ENSVE|nr:hypothetical protein B296_00056478 [Ensete ventricosum]
MRGYVGPYTLGRSLRRELQKRCQAVARAGDRNEPQGDEAGVCGIGFVPWALPVACCGSSGSPVRREQQMLGQGGVSTRSMRDLYCVWAQSWDKSFLTQEMADLPELSGEGSLEAWWASLTPKSQVWANGADVQLFYQGLLCPPLAKEIYTSPSEALLDNATKNLVMIS